MPVKTTMRSSPTPARMTVAKKARNSSVGEIMEGEEPSKVGRNVNHIQSLEK